MPVVVPYSTHARGVPLWDRSLLLDAPRHIARILLTLRDTLSSAFWAITTQGWCSITSVIISVLSGLFSLWERGRRGGGGGKGARCGGRGRRVNCQGGRQGWRFLALRKGKTALCPFLRPCVDPTSPGSVRRRGGPCRVFPPHFFFPLAWLGVAWGLGSRQAAAGLPSCLLFSPLLPHVFFPLFSPPPSLLAVTFFHFFFPSDTLSADLQWTPICFAVVLPCIVFAALSWLRREEALRLFSEVKTTTLSLHALYHDWADCDPCDSIVTVALKRVFDSLLAYLPPPRFTSVFFPYRGVRPVMARLAESRERHAAAIALATRALHASVTDMRAPPSNLAPALEASLHARVDSLALAVERLGDIKEYRTPLAVRATARIYLTLLEPIFWGSYGAWVAEQANYGFAFFFTAVSQLAIVSTLNLLVAFEDPFDNSGMDLVYVPERVGEILRELERAENAWKDLEGTTGGGGEGRGGGGGGGTGGGGAAGGGAGRAASRGALGAGAGGGVGAGHGRGGVGGIPGQIAMATQGAAGAQNAGAAVAAPGTVGSVATHNAADLLTDGGGAGGTQNPIHAAAATANAGR